LGDVVRTVPAVRIVARAWPEARIAWAVDVAWRVVLDDHPDVDLVVDIPRREWGRAFGRPADWPRFLRSVLERVGVVRRLAPALALDFHGDLRSGLIGRISGAAIRVGYDGHQQREGNRMFSTHRVPSGDRRTPRMERNLSLVRAVGLATDPLPRPDLPLVVRGRAEADAVLGAAGPAPGSGCAILAPGASRRQAYKKPPPELLAAACSTVERRGGTPLVVWGPGEEEDARRVVALAGPGTRLAPKTSLATLAALLDRARIFVGGDSGPMHVACAVGCPVVAIYGPTDPVVNQPWGVPSRVVAPRDRAYTGRKSEDRGRGFHGLASEDVERAVAQLWDASGDRGP
jgi:3-deoxy-D-manno-octulosonic-acid transferase/heptosyltransferase-1